MPQLLWPPGPAAPQIGPDAVHVWAASLAPPREEREALATILSDDEQERAARYLVAGPREQFVVARGVLRSLLGRYLGVEPRGLSFGQNRHGKPILLSPGSRLHFNVSHSREVALYAFALRGEVGVDVEHCRPHASHLDLARRFFTPAEADALTALPLGESESAFFRVWTRKEAFLKLLGLGLAGGTESFEVSVPPDEPARLVRLHGQEGPAARYALENLTPAEGYAGALAVEGHGSQLELWSWG